MSYPGLCIACAQLINFTEFAYQVQLQNAVVFLVQCGLSSTVIRSQKQ